VLLTAHILSVFTTPSSVCLATERSPNFWSARCLM